MFQSGILEQQKYQSGSFSTAHQVQSDLEITITYKPETCGQRAEQGDTVSIHYTGYLTEDEIFHSTHDGDSEPVKFIVGRHMTMSGLDSGTLGMCLGEERRLVIPPHLGYNKKDRPVNVPENTQLILNVELVGVEKRGYYQYYVDLCHTLYMPSFIMFVLCSLWEMYKDRVQARKNFAKRQKYFEKLSQLR
ncbi:hypothetical protein ScPMuIL_007893 [Solemya velum]